MSDAKVKVTLIGKHLARPGVEFVYNGELLECEGCKVQRVCNNLETGKRYRILAVRSQTLHECRLHQDGALAVEVIDSPLIALIPAERAIVNSTIVFEPICSIETCKSNELCSPEGIINGDRYVVGEVLGNAPEECEKGKILKLVELRPI